MAKMISALVLGGTLLAQNWTQFRGPNGGGISTAKDFPVEFGPSRNVVWNAAVPNGKSSPVFAKGRIFLTGHEDDKLLTFAIDQSTGRVLWRAEVSRSRLERRHKLNDAAAPTPVTDGDNVYCFFADFGVVSYSAEGKERWRLPLPPMPSMQGVAGSPILAGGKLLLVVDQAQGSYMLAVNPRNGEVQWRQERKPAPGGAYSTPVQLGPDEVVTFSPFALENLSVSTGAALWRASGLPPQPKASPIVAGGVIYCLAKSFYGDNLPAISPFDIALEQNDRNKDGLIAKDEAPEGPAKQYFGVVDRNKDGFVNAAEWQEMIEAASPKSALVAVDRQGKFLWKFHRNIPDVPSPLFYEGLLYMVQNGGILTALNPATGELVKQGRLTGALGDYYASPVAAAGRLYLANQEGKVAVVRAGSEWEVLAVNDLGEEIYATPALVDGAIYVRTGRALYRFEEARTAYRRLFLDPLVIEASHGVERVFHSPAKHPANPLLKADTPWERGGSGPYLYGTVLRDPEKFRMWYHYVRQGYRNAYAESADGIHWTKPKLGLIEFEGSKENNLFVTVSQDPAENPPRRERGQCHNPSVIREGGRWALFCYGADYDKVRAAFSDDGLRWNFVPETARQGLFESSDVVNFFWDPYQRRYTATWKGATRRGRSVGVAFSEDGLRWEKPVAQPIFTADDLDPPDTQIYGMPVFPYQGLYIGLPWIYHARVHYPPEMLQTREEAEAASPLTVDVQLAWSWDLIHWTRPPRRQPFLANGPEGAFDSKMIYTARAPVEVDGKLYFYYGGFDTRHGAKTMNGAIGLAILRQDGFCSMRAGREEGWLLTRRERMPAPSVRINAAVDAGGEISAELVDLNGTPVPGFTRRECVPFRGDSVAHTLTWTTSELPEPRRAEPRKIRFYLRNANLFSYFF